jgi:3-oxoacyl-[acyl-carrier-protein] synthase II
MSRACVIARGAVSALGVGRAATAVGQPGQPARCAIVRDPALASAGLAKPNAARVAAEQPLPVHDDRATALLLCALEQLAAELDVVLPGWRARRLGVALGTSSGGMLSAERFFLARASAERPTAALARPASYFAPYCEALGQLGLDVGDGHGRDPAPGALGVPVRSTQILAACASSTMAIGLGLRWLDRRACDLCVAGGYDGVSVFVAAGFEALRATSANPPEPFRLGRDGMSLGEGAGVVALVRAEDAPRGRSFVHLAGFGASNDAVHITAPDRTGAGLARAARAALGDAGGPSRIDLVSAHATATLYNDAMEARAIAAVCDTDPVVHPFKAQIGHTLGAAGVLELLAAHEALELGLGPAAAGRAAIDPDARVRLLECTEPMVLERALKLSAAFGGVTAALVAQRDPGPEPRHPFRRVWVKGHARVVEVDRAELCVALGMPRDRLARIDDLGQLALGAIDALAREVGRQALVGAGVVIGYGLATLDVNERYHARLRAKGARSVDPRLFPATTPNAAAGHCAIAFGLTGPNFAVGAGLGGGIEALCAAAELVAAHDADRMVVVAADEAGPASRQWLELVGLSHRALERGAVAVLLTHDAGAEAGAREVDLDQPIEHAHGPIGQLGLLAWLEAGPARHGSPR